MLNIQKGSIVRIYGNTEMLELLFEYENGYIARTLYTRKDKYITPGMIEQIVIF